jgi:hypothetical protein
MNVHYKYYLRQLRLRVIYLIAEDAEDMKEAAAVATGEETIVSIYRMSNALIVARKATIPLDVPSRKRTMNDQTWFPKRISKTCFKLQ